MSENDETGSRNKRPAKKVTSKEKMYIGPDGLRRPPKVEHQLNECFAIIFRGQAGKNVLDYLKSITTNRVIGPGEPENTYAYHEGARWLMGVISTRIKDGEEKKP